MWMSRIVTEGSPSAPLKSSACMLKKDSIRSTIRHKRDVSTVLEEVNTLLRQAITAIPPPKALSSVCPHKRQGRLTFDPNPFVYLAPFFWDQVMSFFFNNSHPAVQTLRGYGTQPTWTQSWINISFMMTVTLPCTACIHSSRVKSALVQPKQRGVRITENMFVKAEHHISSRDEILVN